MLKDLRGMTALITGASKRLGRALALSLASEGVNIIAHYSASAAEAEELRQELSERSAPQGGSIKAWTIKADFTKPSEYGTLVVRAADLAGRLDILINNASVFIPGRLADMTFRDLVRDMEVNAWTPFILTRELSRLGRGSVINMLDSKIGGRDPQHASYILSKQMLSAITRISAVEFAPAVRVNAIAPGLILPPAGKDETYFQTLSHNVPLNRHGEPDDIGAAAVYLLRNDFITGQTIFVDGGSHLAK